MSVFRPNIKKTVTQYTPPAIQSDEESNRILQTVKDREDAKKRQDAEKREAEAEKRPAPEVPKAHNKTLSDTEQTNFWKEHFRKEAARVLEEEQKKEVENQALQQCTQEAENKKEAQKLVDENALIQEMHQNECIRRKAPVSDYK
jgi:hypothetical protein